MKIVLYDGECAFCNKSVSFILRHNARRDIFVCSSQSEYAQTLVSKYQIEANFDETIVYIENNKVFIKSTAALRIAKSLAGMLSVLFYLGVLCPRFIRDWVYDFISKRRKRIIKQDERCDLSLSKKHQSQILE